MAKPPPSPSPARAALAEAVQAVRDRADERARTEAALELASDDMQKSWREISELESALKDRPRTAAEDLLLRAGRSVPHHVRAQIEDQILAEEPASSRDLKACLVLAEEILADRKQVRDELRNRIEGFDAYDYTTQRARQAARDVVREEASAVIAQAVADGEAAMLTLAKVRATLGWLQTHRVFGDLDQNLPKPVRDVVAPFQDAQDRQFRAARASSAWGGVIDGLLADPTMPLPGADTF